MCLFRDIHHLAVYYHQKHMMCLFPDIRQQGRSGLSAHRSRDSLWWTSFYPVAQSNIRYCIDT
jgi:hypothetical protein